MLRILEGHVNIYLLGQIVFLSLTCTGRWLHLTAHRTNEGVASMPTGLIHAQVYESVEMRLLPVLAAAQARGIPVDISAAERQLCETEAAAAAARRAACATACLTIDFDDVRSREAALDAVGAGAAAFRDAAGGARPLKCAQVRRCVSRC